MDLLLVSLLHGIPHLMSPQFNLPWWQFAPLVQVDSCARLTPSDQGKFGMTHAGLETSFLEWTRSFAGQDDYKAVAAIANPTSVTKERVSEIEAETKHDIMALTKAMAEAAGEAGWCIHLGATSNDIVDTAVALQLRDSIVLLREQLCLLIGVCADVAERLLCVPQSSPIRLHRSRG